MRTCKYCGAAISSESRDDKSYCDSSTCRAKYHMEVGREYRGSATEHLLHKELEWVHPYACEVCGLEFSVNDYAERGGKRVPMYCSKKCKQKAYRERIKVSNESG